MVMIVHCILTFLLLQINVSLIWYFSMWEPYKKEKFWSFRILLDTVYNYSYFVSGDLSYGTSIISYHMSTWVCCVFFSAYAIVFVVFILKLYFVMQTVYTCNISLLLWNKLKKVKNLHGEQLCNYILRQYCT